MARDFDYAPAVLQNVPLSIGIAGFSGAGKTESALRIATGIASVRGGDISVIDTESRRAAHYAKKYKFMHVPFAPPFGPDDYREAIAHCIKKGARTIVVDNMSHEHDGDGGVLDQMDEYLDAKCGDDVAARERNLMVSSIKPKRARKRLNLYIEQQAHIAFIFTYRAEPKVKPVKGKGVVDMGMQPITTSNLIYQMTLRILLRPGADGVPTIKGDTAGENMIVKSNGAFRDWPELKGSAACSEELGVKLATWARGDAPAATTAPSSPAEPKFAAKYPEWGGKPLKAASLETVAAYIDQLTAKRDELLLIPPDDQEPGYARVLVALNQSIKEAQDYFERQV